VQLSLIFKFKTDSYATWAISVFLQVSMQSLFGKHTTVGWHDILKKLKGNSKNTIRQMKMEAQHAKT